MTNLIQFSSDFILLSFYSFATGLILYFFSHVALKLKSFVLLWRDFWMVLIGMCTLPLLFSLIPYSYHAYSVFDVNLLQLSQISSPSILPLIDHTNSSPESISFSVIGIASILWLGFYLLGLIYTLTKLMIQIKLINSIIKSSSNITNIKHRLNNPMYQLLTNIGNQYKVQVLFSPLSISPFVYQWRKKYLILPQSFFNDSNFSQEQIDLIIDHELTHIKNSDQLMVMLCHFMTCVLWFNPFVRNFKNNMNWAIEAHCDSEVLTQKPHLRKIYAQTMLRILRQSATTTSNHMVAAFSTKTHRSLTMRINNIMKPLHHEVKLKSKKKKLWATALSIGLLMFITQPRSFASPDSVKTGMINPVKQAKVTSQYGAKNKFHQFHNGIDLGAKIDTPIVASAAGVVRISTNLLENKKNYGTIIIIDHIDGFHSVYAHLNSRSVSTGDKVDAGQLIGYVGETGKASGPHLHLELLKDNKHVNPSDFIEF